MICYIHYSLTKTASDMFLMNSLSYHAGFTERQGLSVIDVEIKSKKVLDMLSLFLHSAFGISGQSRKE